MPRLSFPVQRTQPLVPPPRPRSSSHGRISQGRQYRHGRTKRAFSRWRAISYRWCSGSSMLLVRSPFHHGYKSILTLPEPQNSREQGIASLTEKTTSAASDRFALRSVFPQYSPLTPHLCTDNSPLRLSRPPLEPHSRPLQIPISSPSARTPPRPS